jgi:hypothetical protein
MADSTGVNGAPGDGRAGDQGASPRERAAHLPRRQANIVLDRRLTTVLVRTRVSRIHRDRGVEIVEWGASLLLIAAIVGVLVSIGLPQLVEDRVSYAICRVFSPRGDCNAPQTDARGDRFKPKACAVSTSTNSSGGKVDIALFDVGRDITFIRTTDSKGKVVVTAVDAASVGVGTGVGAGYNIRNKVNIGADLKVHGGLKLGMGEGWEFSDPKKANRFIAEIQKRTHQQALKKSWGLRGLVVGSLWSVVDPPRVREPDIEKFEVEVGVDGGGITGVGAGPRNDKPAKNRRERLDRRTRGDQPGLGVNANLNGYAKIDGKEKAIAEFNKTNGEKSLTLQVSGGAKAGVNYVVDGKQVRGETRGAVKLTYDKDGNLSRLTLTRTGIVNGKSEIATTEVPITNEKERNAVYQQLFADQAAALLIQSALAPGVPIPIAGTPLRLTMDDMTPDTPPGANATPLQRLLYERGSSSKVYYDYDADEKAYGASVKFGLMLGLGVNFNRTSQKATSGQYLSAPSVGGTGGRHWRNFEECSR